VARLIAVPSGTFPRRAVRTPVVDDHAASQPLTTNKEMVAMPEFNSGENFPVFPVFLLIDVSYSMIGGPITAVNECLPQLKEAVGEDPTVGEIARVGLLTFSDKGTTKLPLSDLQYVDLPTLTVEAQTNFAEAFRVARREIDASMLALGKGTRFHRPVLFFLSDGFHNAPEDWRAPLRGLKDPHWRFHPEIVVFGFGEADQAELSEIATTHAFMAKNVDPAQQVKEIIPLIVSSIKTTSVSLPHSGGGLTIEPDLTKFTPLPLGTV
jgi:uncharacterized protein YegL